MLIASLCALTGCDKPKIEDPKIDGSSELNFIRSIQKIEQHLDQYGQKPLTDDIFFLAAKAVAMPWDKEVIVSSLATKGIALFQFSVIRAFGTNRPAEAVQSEFRAFMAELDGKSAKEIFAMADTLRKNSLQVGSGRRRSSSFTLVPKSIQDSIPPERVDEFALFHILCYAFGFEEAVYNGETLPPPDMAAAMRLMDKTAYDIIGMGSRRVASRFVAQIPECAAIDSSNAQDVCSLLMARKVLPTLEKE